MRQKGSIIEKTRKLVAVIAVAFITISLGLCLCDTVNAAAAGAVLMFEVLRQRTQERLL